MPSAKVRTVSSWSGNKERRDQQSQREDTKKHIFLVPVAYCGIQRPVQWLKVWQRRSGREEVPGSPSPPLPEQTTLFGTYTENIQAREAYRTFLFVCTKNITTGRAGDIFLMQVFVCMVNCLKQRGGLVDGWDRRKSAQVGGCPGSGWVQGDAIHPPHSRIWSALVCLTMMLVCPLILLS